MTRDLFVKAIKLYVSDSAVKSTIESLEKPPGRSPDRRRAELSRWYHSFGDKDKRMLARAIGDAAETAVFGFFCVLDGVRAVEERTDKGEFELWYVNKEERTRMDAREGAMLHDLYNWYSRDQFRQRRGRS